VNVDPSGNQMPEWGWLEHIAVVVMSAAILLAMWWWAGATMDDGLARDYQCSVGNQRPFVCDSIIRQQDRSPQP
jgi:ferric-dicitrate binding protein FerR (iron transport regulator)